MVRLEEVDDEELAQGQDGPQGGEDDWDTDSESDASETSSLASDIDDLSHETLLDRIYALQDILPPTQRRFLSSTVSTGSSWIKSSLSFSGNALWVVSTSLLLLGVPWALAYAEEMQMVEMEREMSMQQKAGELLTSPSGDGDARPALA